MSLDRDQAAAFVENHGATWESWDVARFVALFSDDAVYVAHPTEESVVGREALRRYVEKEQAEQGSVAVHMGTRSSRETTPWLSGRAGGRGDQCAGH